MSEKPTVEQALRYCENSKISDPYVLLEVLSEEVKRLRTQPCRHGNDCTECFYVSHPGHSA